MKIAIENMSKTFLHFERLRKSKLDAYYYYCLLEEELISWRFIFCMSKQGKINLVCEIGFIAIIEHLK